MKHVPLITVGALIEREGKFLLCKLAEYKGVDGLKWALPAGKWDQDEDVLAGVRREVKEETGYDFEPTSILGFYSRLRDWPDKTHNTIRVIFRGNISGEPTPLAHDVIATKWFTADEIMAMDEQTIRTFEVKTILHDFHAGQDFPLSALKHFEGRK